MNTAFWLSITIGKQLCDHGEHVYLYALGLRNEQRWVEVPNLFACFTEVLSCSIANPFISTTTVNTLPSPRPDTSLCYPMSIPTHLFSWDQVLLSDPPEKVSDAAIAAWWKNPEPMQGQAFLNIIEGEQTVFRLSYFLTWKKKKVFYIQFIDDDEAIGYPRDTFFEMLSQVEWVDVQEDESDEEES